MRCYRMILGISYKDHVTNEEVRAEIQQAIGPHEDLTIVKRRKVQWYGRCLTFIRSGQNHLARHSGRGKKTRQRKRREDNIREWTGLEFTKSQRRTGKNGGNWLRNHLCCPNDSRG